jgi:competence protein ComEA
MDRSVMPWRVLEAADPAAEPSPAEAASTAWRTWPIIGGLAAAAGLAAVAIALVASGPAPSAIVQPEAAVAVTTEQAGDPGASIEVPPGEVVVHVAGAVARPGLVRLPVGSRVADAIDAAGGLGPRVDVGRLGRDVNLAAIVNDGERVTIPSRDDPAIVTQGSGGSSGGPTSGGGLVDLNRATAGELEALPGIGEVTAGKIIAARDERPFRTLDELLERKVVGRATLEKIRDLVVVR